MALLLFVLVISSCFLWLTERSATLINSRVFDAGHSCMIAYAS